MAYLPDHCAEDLPLKFRFRHRDISICLALHEKLTPILGSPVPVLGAVPVLGYENKTGEDCFSFLKIPLSTTILFENS